MNNSTISLIFRKPAPQFNSIENVFKPLLPYFDEEFLVDRVFLPHRTRGVLSMRKNLKYIESRPLGGIVHITGHENYMVRGGGERALLTLHDINSAFTGRKIRDSFIRYNWFKMPVMKANKISVISEYSALAFIEQYPEVEKKIRVIPNPVPADITFAPKALNEAKPLILQIGTKENKNLKRVAEALKGLDCTLMVLGPLSALQSAMLKSFEIDYVNKSFLPFNEVLDLYYESDILVFASLYEGFGMPILEAQACGRPVITSTTSAMPSTAGDGACLVDPESVGEIRDAIKTMIRDANYRNALIESGKKNIEKYQAKIIAEKYIALYREMLNGN